MNNNLNINYEEMQKEIDIFNKLLRQLIKCREAKQLFEWQAYNLCSGQTDVVQQNTEAHKSEYAYVEKKENFLQSITALKNGWDVQEITSNRRFYCGDYRWLSQAYGYSDINEYYPYTVSKKIFFAHPHTTTIPASIFTLCHVSGLKNPIQKMLKEFAKNFYNEARLVIAPLGTPDWERFIRRQCDVIRNYYHISADYLYNNYHSEIEQVLASQGNYTQAVHTLRCIEHDTVIAKFYDEFLAGIGDVDNPNPAWTWKAFIRDDQLFPEFDPRLACPQAVALAEAYNSKWKNYSSYSCDSFLAHSGHITIPLSFEIDVDDWDVNYVISTFENICGVVDMNIKPYIPEHYGATEYINYDYDHQPRGNLTILLDEETNYNKGLTHIGGQRFSFIPSVDENGAWMSDTIDFDYIGVIDIDEYDTEIMDTSELFAYLGFFGMDLWRVSEFSKSEEEPNYEEIYLFLNEYYTINDHSTYGCYIRGVSSDDPPDPWDRFMAANPNYNNVKSPFWPRNASMLLNYLKNNFSIDYMAAAAEFFGRWNYRKGDTPDSTEIAKIKQILIDSEPELVNLFGQ